MKHEDLCSLVDAFHDGQLEGDDDAAFRTHLATCEACAAELHQLAMVDATAHRAFTAPRARESATVLPFRPARRQRALVGGVVALVVAAAAAFALRVSAPQEPVALLAPGADRTLEARVSFGAADAYRPYEVMRGGAPASGTVSLGAIATLERRKDLHGVAAGYLLQQDPARASSYLERAEASLDVEADRALLAYEQRDLPAALAGFAAVLARSPQHGPARWNRALVLRDLGLPRSAAAAFEAAAAAHEAGWSDEARLRAATARERVTEEQRGFSRDAGARERRATSLAESARTAKGRGQDELARAFEGELAALRAENP